MFFGALEKTAGAVGGAVKGAAKEAVASVDYASMFNDPTLMKGGKAMLGNLPKIGDPVQMAMAAGKKVAEKIPGADMVRKALHGVADVGEIAAGLA